MYADLIVPGWLAPILRPDGGRVAGVFTRDDLDRCFEALGLQVIDISARGLHYEALLRKDRGTRSV